MLRSVNNAAAFQVKDMSSLMYTVYKTLNPVAPREKGQCRFMLFVRLRPDVPSHFQNLSRTGYYPGNKYTDSEPEMLKQLLKMIDKEIMQRKRFDRYELYDNDKEGTERIIFKLTNDCIEKNDLQLYSLMLTNFILPLWLKQ